MTEQNVNYIVSINFPELDLLEYCCERFAATLNDAWLVIIESASYLQHARLNIIDDDTSHIYPLTLKESDYYNIIDNDWYIQEVVDEIARGIIETMNIPTDPKVLFNILVDMQINYGSVNSFYTIDSNGVYNSDYEMYDVIKEIYYGLLLSILYEFDDNIINIVNLLLAGYDVSLTEVIPDHMANNNNYHDKLMIVYNINRKQ